MLTLLRKHRAVETTKREAWNFPWELMSSLEKGGPGAPSPNMARAKLAKKASQTWHTIEEQTTPDRPLKTPTKDQGEPGRIIAPQAGPQTTFLSTPADIAFYGGQAGGGKTFALLLEALRGLNYPGYRGVIFRRTCPHITRPGGLWDAACQLYPAISARPRESNLDWTFNGGGRVQFAHMQLDADRLAWQGSEVPFIGWDEVTHFSARQFWYLVSRNRSTCGVRPYVRATCNPEPGSWVAALLDWWIGEDGYPIASRSGKIRWFVRDGDNIIWGNSPADLPADRREFARSFTFIAASLDDNPALTSADPGYRSQLESLPAYERALLLGGNWKVSASKGMRFRRGWFGAVVDKLPGTPERTVRYWDRAGTEESPINSDPDRTAGVKISKIGETYYVEHCAAFRKLPHDLRREIATYASQDDCPKRCELWLEQDPASAGKAERADLAVHLRNFAPRFAKPTGSKWTRSGPASAAAENGLIKLVRGAWNEDFLRELEDFVDEKQIDVDVPKHYHDDRVDAFTGAFNVLSRGLTAGVW